MNKNTELFENLLLTAAAVVLVKKLATSESVRKLGSRAFAELRDPQQLQMRLSKAISFVETVSHGVNAILPPPESRSGNSAQRSAFQDSQAAH